MGRTPPRFEVSSAPAGDVATLAVAGDLDASAAEPLVARVAELASESAGGRVALELSGVTFIDSSGLKALLDARAACGGAGASLLLVAPSDPVIQLLDMVDLTRTFEVEGAGGGPSGV